MLAVYPDSDGTEGARGVCAPCLQVHRDPPAAESFVRCRRFVPFFLLNGENSDVISMH